MRDYESRVPGSNPGGVSCEGEPPRDNRRWMIMLLQHLTEQERQSDSHLRSTERGMAQTCGQVSAVLVTLGACALVFQFSMGL